MNNFNINYNLTTTCVIWLTLFSLITWSCQQFDNSKTTFNTHPIEITSSSYGAIAHDNNSKPHIIFSPHGDKILSFTPNNHFETLQKEFYNEKMLDAHGVSYFDIDFDCIDDILISTGARKGTKPGKGNLLFQNINQKWKKKRLPFTNMIDKRGRTRCLLPIDINLDGSLDVFVVNYNPKKFEHNKLFFSNINTSTYSESSNGYGILEKAFSSHFIQCQLNQENPVMIGQYQGSDSGKIFAKANNRNNYQLINKQLGLPDRISGSRCIKPYDVDRDGDQDLIVALDVGEKKSYLEVYIYDSGKYKSPIKLPIADRVTTLLIEDIDNDGAKDILACAVADHLSTLYKVIPVLSNSEVDFKIESIWEIQDSISSGFPIEVNSDGKPDLFLFSGYGSSKGKHYLLENMISTTNNFVDITLEGSVGNCNGLLSKLKINYCDKTINTQVIIGNTFYGHYDKSLHIGLGDCNECTIEVTWWSSGQTTNHTISKVNQSVTLNEN